MDARSMGNRTSVPVQRVASSRFVQRATVAVLNCIYEEEFLGFSYGFRPKRGQHDALDALAVDSTGSASSPTC
jgi:hypothetical protein